MHFDYILNLYEIAATKIQRLSLAIELLAMISLCLGLYFIAVENKIPGFWFVFMAIWAFGIDIFSEMYALKENTLVDGDYVLRSKVRNSGIFIAVFGTLFYTAWFLGLLFITAVLFMKSVGIDG